MALTRYNPDRTAVSREERFFVCKETAFGGPDDVTQIVEPVDADQVMNTAAASFKQDPEKRQNKERWGSRSKKKPILGRLTHGKFSLPVYLKPSGTAGTAPAEGKLLEAALGATASRAADTVQVGSGTVSSFIPATLSNFKAGQPVLVAIGTHYELRRISVVDTEVHVVPDFSGAPADAATITAAVKYSLAEDLPSLVVWRYLGDEVIIYPGCVVEGLSGLKFDGESDVSATFAGGYQREIRCGTDKLSLDVAAAGTLTITVEDGRKYDIGARLNLSDGTNTETKLVVTDKAANAAAGHPNRTDLTVVRGTGAQAWIAADGVDVYPWIPSGADLGSPIQARRGACTINDEALDVLSVELGLTNKVNWHEKEKTASGKDYVGSYALAEDQSRDIKCNTEVYFRQKHQGMFVDANEQTAQDIFVPAFDMDSAGNPVPGHVLVAVVPQSEFKSPDVGEDAGEFVLKVDTDVYASSAKNDEFAVWAL